MSDKIAGSSLVSETAERSALTAAGGMNKAFTPYFVQYFYPPKQVLELFPDPDVTYNTPGFTFGQKEFTTQEQMMAFLKELNESCETMRLEIIGSSLEGREIPLIIFTTSENEDTEDFKKKPTVWLQAQVHGNEPASGESTLVMAQKLAKEELGQELLNDINVVIVPRMNPDSAYYFERLSVTKLNGNRDHINLEMPELQAIHNAFNRFEPEVVIDAHEYGATPQYKEIGEEGAMKYHDVTILSGKNLNIPKIIREKSDEWLIQSAFTCLEKSGISYGKYYTVNTSENEKPMILEGGVDAGTGRNTFGLKPSFSILVETLGIGIGRENFLRRVTGQVITHTSILRATKKHAAQIKQIVQDAKAEIANQGSKGKENGKIILKSDRQEIKGDQHAKAIDIAKGKVIEIPVRYFSSTDSIKTMERVRPNAYLLPPGYHEISKKLAIQGGHIQKLREDQELYVECYEVVEKAVKDSWGQVSIQVKTKIEEKKRFFPKGSYLISSAQYRSHLISLALEPESDSSFVTQNYFPIYKGGEIPIYRYMNDIDFDLED